MLEHNASVVFPAAPLLTVILALIGKNEKEFSGTPMISCRSIRHGSDYV